MLGDQSLVAFVATSHAEKCKSFYQGTLGLPLTSEDPFALVFDAHGTALRIQKVESFTPHPFTALGWAVKDADAMVKALTEKGVVFERYGFLQQDALGIWSAPGGARVAWFKDPDGNVLSLTAL